MLASGKRPGARIGSHVSERDAGPWGIGHRTSNISEPSMELTLERENLLKALAHVHSVVERRNTIPILANVLLRAEGGELALAATDMDLEIVETVQGDVTRSGATTVSAHTLHDIVRKLPDGAEVRLDGSTDGKLAIRAGRSRFSLACLPAEDFPLVSGGDLPCRFTLDAAALRGLIDRTRFAISTEETRYYLNGIYLHVASLDGAASVLRAVATDGHRLARVEMPVPEGAAELPGVIVPRKAIGEMRKLIDDSSDAVGIELSDTRIRVGFDKVVLTSKLIDGTFPNYDTVIPSGNDKIMEVDRRALHAAVDRVSTISAEKSRAVKLALAPGTLTLSATSPEHGTASEELEVDYQSEAMEIGFNARYLMDITQQIEDDQAQFAMADAASPALVRAAADDGALYVLMPMRV